MAGLEQGRENEAEEEVGKAARPRGRAWEARFSL